MSDVRSVLRNARLLAGEEVASWLDPFEALDSVLQPPTIPAPLLPPAYGFAVVMAIVGVLLNLWAICQAINADISIKLPFAALTAGLTAASGGPPDVAADTDLRIARQKIDLKLYDQALETLRRIIGGDNDERRAVDAYFLIASIHDARGRIEDAMSTYLEIASRYPAFPIVLETVREVLRDVFDVPALTGLLRDIAARRVRIVEVETATPSPFGKSLLFRYVGAFMYEGDAPLAERRAQALSLDTALLAELLGQDGLRELLDPAVVDQTERDLQHLSENRRCRDLEGVSDLLRTAGPLTALEVADRSVSDRIHHPYRISS